MNFKQRKKPAKVAVKAAAYGLGGLTSKGAVSLISKKFGLDKMVAQGLIAAVGIAGASYINQEFAADVFAGMSAMQVADLVADKVAPMLPENDGSLAKQFLHDTFGSAQLPPAAAGRRRGRGRLGNPLIRKNFLASPGNGGTGSLQFAKA